MYGVCKYIPFHWQSQHLFVCKTAEEVRILVRDNAKVDERRGDQATPLIVQVMGYAVFTLTCNGYKTEHLLCVYIVHRLKVEMRMWSVHYWRKEQMLTYRIM